MRNKRDKQCLHGIGKLPGQFDNIRLPATRAGFHLCAEHINPLREQASAQPLETVGNEGDRFPIHLRHGIAQLGRRAGVGIKRNAY
jgi:hypothetical protein